MIASTRQGKVQGLEKEGVLQFRGIRFATAERFRAPAPVEPWDDVADATEYGAIAPQNPSPLETMLGSGDSPSGEDCLFLNVFTPAIDDTPRPVLVWIHGGGFTAGAGSIPWYNGSRLASQGDVVVVTINYRLGSLGFLAVPGFAGSGAAGIADQVAALEWVRDNIAGFGGDPANVTIFGESAGGMSVSSLLATPSARGLFHSAIAQSGAGEHAQSVEAAARVTEAMLRELGASDPAALLDATVEQLLAAQQAVGNRLSAVGENLLPFGPVVDGTVLDQRPLDAIRAGAARDVGLITGTTSDEWNLFHVLERATDPLTDAKLEHRVARAAGDRAADLIDVYRSSRPGATADDIWCAIATDWVFRMPAVRMLEAQSAVRETWGYELTYKSSAFEGHLGACHAIDVPFVFDNLHRGGVDFLLGTIDDTTRQLAADISRSWMTMAADGNPNHGGLPSWAPYTPEARTIMAFGRTTEVIDDPRPAEREAWTELAG